MKKIISCGVFTLSIVWLGVLASIAQAECPLEAKASRGGCAKGCSVESFFGYVNFILENQSTLGLSDDQLSAVKDLKISTQKSLTMRKAEIDVINIDIDVKMWEENMNKDTLNELMDRKFDHEKAKAKFLVESFMTLNTTLASEQKKSLQALWKKGMTEDKPCPFASDSTEK